MIYLQFVFRGKQNSLTLKASSLSTGLSDSKGEGVTVLGNVANCLQVDVA